MISVCWPVLVYCCVKLGALEIQRNPQPSIVHTGSPGAHSTPSPWQPHQDLLVWTSPDLNMANIIMASMTNRTTKLINDGVKGSAVEIPIRSR